MIQVKTNSKVINWLVSKAQYEDQSDDIDIYKIGKFMGILPANMVDELKQFGRKNGGDKHTGSGTFCLAKTINSDTITLTEIRLLFGQTKSTSRTVSFIIDYQEWSGATQSEIETVSKIKEVGK
jgi:hypothetical protein